MHIHSKILIEHLLHVRPCARPWGSSHDEDRQAENTYYGLHRTLLKPLMACTDHFSFLCQCCLEQIRFVLRLKGTLYVQCLAECLEYSK